MRTKCINLMGPHTIDILSLIIGSTLGDTHLERRKHGKGTRIIFEQSSKNIEYLMWFHKFLSERGYCSKNKPKLIKRIKKDNTIYYGYRISSYTYQNFNFIHDMFYVKINDKYTKIIPSEIEKYLNPFVLSIWYMNDGSKLGKGAKIAVNYFDYNSLLNLSNILSTKFNLKNSLHKAKDKYTFYIWKESMPLFILLIKPYMISTMENKLGIT